MAKRFLTAIDLQNNELQNVQFQNLASDPGTGLVEGRVYYNTTSDVLRVYANGAWANVGSAGTITSVSGTTNEVSASTVGGAVTVGLPDDVTITQDLGVGRDLTVTGNLTVNGTTTTLNTTDLLVEDNIIVLNSGVTGAPSLNAGVEIERGSSANVVFRWNESTDKWQVTEDGSTYTDIALTGHSHTAANISDFNEAAQDAVGTIVSGSNSLSVTYNDATPSIVFDTTLASSNSYLSKTSGLAVDISGVETKLVTDGFTKKVSASVGNGVATAYAVTHSLGTRDVVVNVYDNATYDTVEVDVVRTDTNTVTVTFASAPASNAYRVVVIG
jgi:hypothetical protein